MWSPARLEALVARYDAEIAYFDDHFGRLLAHLRARGLYDDALIVLTADHGEEFGEHGGFRHGHTLYGELLGVPLVVKYPGGEGAGRRVATPAALVDVVPSVADVLGADWRRADFRGRSLRLDATGRAIYADNADPELRAVIRGDDKLIQRLDAAGDAIDEAYYTLDADPGERREMPSTSLPPARLTALRRFAREVGTRTNETSAIAVDDDTYRELRALGYVE